MSVVSTFVDILTHPIFLIFVYLNVIHAVYILYKREPHDEDEGWRRKLAAIYFPQGVYIPTLWAIFLNTMSKLGYDLTREFDEDEMREKLTNKGDKKPSKTLRLTVATSIFSFFVLNPFILDYILGENE